MQSALLGIERRAWRAAERELAETYVPPPVAPRATSETALVPVCVREQFPFVR